MIKLCAKLTYGFVGLKENKVFVQYHKYWRLFVAKIQNIISRHSWSYLKDFFIGLNLSFGQFPASDCSNRVKPFLDCILFLMQEVWINNLFQVRFNKNQFDQKDQNHFNIRRTHTVNEKCINFVPADASKLEFSQKVSIKCQAHIFRGQELSICYFVIHMFMFRKGVICYGFVNGNVASIMLMSRHPCVSVRV